MSEFQHKNLEGSLFVNSYKERDQHPDYTGKLVVEGKTYQVACWKNQTKNGGDYFKLKLSDDKPREKKSYHSVGDNFKPKSKHMSDYEREQNAYHKAKYGDPEDDIPF